MNVRSQYISIVKESVLLSGTPAYILKYLYNGKWVGIVCDQYGPIYCTTIGGNPDPGDTGTGESGSGATFDDTDIINAIDSVFRAISSVDDSVSYVSTYLSRLNNNFLNFYNDFKVKFEMQGNDLSNIYSVLLAMYQSFYDRFSDLDLSYYNDAEIVINNGGSLDWSESDRGAINVEATDIGTLELIGFPILAVMLLNIALVMISLFAAMTALTSQHMGVVGRHGENARHCGWLFFYYRDCSCRCCRYGSR